MKYKVNDAYVRSDMYVTSKLRKFKVNITYRLRN